MRLLIALPCLCALFVCSFCLGLVAMRFAVAEGPSKNEHSPGKVAQDKVAEGEGTQSNIKSETLKPKAVSGNISVNISDQGLSPEILNVTPGTTVIWMNKTHSKAKVTFLRHAVSTTCRDPRGFLLSDKGIYTSNLIVGGEIASLCFLERQAYDYEVVVLSDDLTVAQGEEGAQVKQILKGTITVH